METYKTLHKTRQDGKTQIWWMERDGNKIRTKSGTIEDGESSMVTSAWKEIRATNIGRSNERSPEDQADFVIHTQYRMRLEQGAVENIGDAPMIIDKIKPILANKYDPKNGVSFPCLSQPKLDGIRCIVTPSGLYSRSWKPIISVPHIAELLCPISEETGIIFDGELYNHELHDDFNKIISLTRKTKPTEEDLKLSEEYIQFWCFDVIDTKTNFVDRFSLTRDINDRRFVSVQTKVCNNQEELDAAYSEYLHLGYEGQMIRYNVPYEHRRSKNLLKRKSFLDREFTIERIEEGDGNWKGYAKVVHCFDKENDVSFRAALKGNQTDAKAILEEREDYVNGTVTVRYQNLTPDGVPRFGVAVAIFKGERDV